MHMDARTAKQHPQDHHLLPSRQGLSLAFTDQARTEPRAPPVSAFQVLGITRENVFWGSNSDPICEASTSPNYFIQQPPGLKLIKFLPAKAGFTGMSHHAQHLDV